MEITVRFGLNNPLFLFQVDRVRPDGVFSHHFKVSHYKDALIKNETAPNWWLKFYTKDHIRLQCLSNIGFPSMQLIRSDGVYINLGQWTQLLESAEEPGLFLYEIDIDLTLINEDSYIPLVTVGTDSNLRQYQGHWFVTSSIVEDFVDTLRFEYWSTKYYGGVWYQTGIRQILRLPATIKPKDFPGVSNVFTDQRLSNRVLMNKSYTEYELTIGHPLGVPAIVALQLSWILGTKYVKIDEVIYAKAESNQKIDLITFSDVGTMGVQLKLREQNEREFVQYNSNWQIGRLMAAVNVDSTGFVLGQNSDTKIITINI